VEAFEPKPIVIVTDPFMATLGTAIRAGLEAFGLRTCLFICASDANIWDVLSNKVPECEHIIFECHGNEGQMLFDVHPEAQIGADEIRSKAHLPDKFILSLGCTTGNAELAAAFLSAGCRGFIGPSGTPHVHTGFLFTLMFYRHLLQHAGIGVDEPKLSEREAFEAAKRFHADAEMFTIYERN